MDNKKYAVILAAGDGKRMKSDKPKVLAEVLFQPMLRWVLDAVKQAGVDNTAVIVGAHKEQVDRKSTRLNSSHPLSSRMPSSA